MAVLLAVAAPASLGAQQSAVETEEAYEPTEAELDSLIDETIAEESATSQANEDPTEPQVEDGSVATESGEPSAVLDEVLEEPETALSRPGGGARVQVAVFAPIPVSATLVAQAQDGDTLVDLAAADTRCDGFGADPLDPDRLMTENGRIDGVADEQLELRDIMKECGPAVTVATVRDERARRHGYIRARALAVMRRYDEAAVQFEILCGAGYGMACYQLALIRSVPRNGAPADLGKARHYARLASELWVPVAGALLERLEGEDWISRTDLPEFHRAILREDLASIPHTVSTQRIVLTLFTRIEQKGMMWRDPPFTITDQQNALKLKVPILSERARAAWSSLPPVFQNAPRGSGLEAFVENMLRMGADVFTFGRRVGAIEVAVAAGDAKTMTADFDARPNSGDRQRYTRSLGRLMALWAQRDPEPDTLGICTLFRAGLQQGCLPLEDYSADAPSIG
ncbi:hypothetical protein Q9Q95_11465 [Sphingomonas sp. DG1-23]|uniref:hypothetical protein n=1 Tax=Sphingomonas sp. DG1-23 TaxID=3068316 RepID=UPI0027402E0B|nr:hypothetical protein [Sphingomonas sp. DG1-23]MDP5279542.1 hypothetical protein [Sphingomonas sp. DG1-23]